MSDGIEFRNVDRPQLKTTEGVCGRCGTASSNVGALCQACMNRGFLTEAWAQQRRAFREHPFIQLVVACDDQRVRHAILIGHPSWSFCGVRPTEPVKKRRQVSPQRLPPELCVECRRRVDEALAEG